MLLWKCAVSDSKELRLSKTRSNWIIEEYRY